MAGTEVAAGQPAVFTQQEQQQPPTALQQGVLTFQAWSQGQVYQQPAQAVVGGFPQQRPVQHIAAPPVGGPGYQFPMVAVAPQPPYNAPHDFFFLAMVTTIMCAIFNLLSLAFGIPALVLSAMSLNARNNKDYPQAKKYGRYSLTMTVLNIFFTLGLAMLITGFAVGCSGKYYYGFGGFRSTYMCSEDSISTKQIIMLQL